MYPSVPPLNTANLTMTGVCTYHSKLIPFTVNGLAEKSVQIMKSLLNKARKHITGPARLELQFK